MVETNPPSDYQERDQRLLYLAIGATVIGIILLIVFAFLLLDENQDDDLVDATETPGGIVDGGFPTPATTPSGDIFVNVFDSSSATTISVTLDTPASLSIGGAQFSLQPVRATIDGVWTPNLPSERSAAWVYGTVVNYVVGIPDTANNRALLDGLVAGDDINLTSQNGNINQFAFDRREIVPSDSAEVFSQQSPGITVILLGTSGTSRLLAQGHYIVPEASGGGTDTEVELGEPAQLDNWQITANSTTFLFDRPEAPAGFAFFLIDFTLENLAALQIDVGTLTFSLLDEFGNRYALNPVASQFGNFPVARGPVQPGDAVNATAGYQIPASLDTNSLTWIVQVAGSDNVLEVRLPFGSQQTERAANISVSQAEVSLDGTSLVLQGDISNLGSEPLVITEGDISLSSGGTVYLLFSTTPGFPWIIGPGQTSPYALQFQRPSQPNAIFSVFSYPFELTGLQ